MSALDEVLTALGVPCPACGAPAGAQHSDSTTDPGFLDRAAQRAKNGQAAA